MFFKVVKLALVALVVCVISITLAACAALRNTDAKDVIETTSTGLDALERACVIANAIFPRSKVAEVCRIAGPKLRAIDDVIASTRAAGAVVPRASPVTCEEDALGAITCNRPYNEDGGGAL